MDSGVYTLPFHPSLPHPQSNLPLLLLPLLLLLQVCYMTDSSNKECVLYLKNRMGIIKMAAVHGIPLIPTFTFNQVCAVLCCSVLHPAMEETAVACGCAVLYQVSSTNKYLST
jgi:hypothetical protein